MNEEFQLSEFAISNAPYLTLSNPHQYHTLAFNMNGITIAIDMNTGDVTHTGTLPEAAKAFWDAVQLMYPYKNNNKE